MIKKVFRRIVIMFIAIIFVLRSIITFSQDENILINIGSDTMQTFRGIGFNLNQYQPWVDNLPAGNRVNYVKNLVNIWGFNSVVLWGDKWGTECCGANDPRNAVDTTQFEIRENVLQTVRWLHEAGMENMLMMPIRDRPEAQHVDFWTNCALMWKNKGVDITGMSFLNKPNTGHGFQDSGTSRREPDSIVSGIKALKAELELKELSDVKIFGPSVVEWHPRQFATFGDSYDFEDGDTAAYLNPLVADSVAMSSLYAIDMQSYGRGLTNWEYNLASQAGKELWVSLSATDGLNNNMNDPILGPISAGNLLSNLNHGVTLWHHWLLSDLTNTDGSFKQRMFYIVNISTNINPGARLRSCTSDSPDLPSPDMRWNYNLQEDGTVTDWQPDIISAAGENPDETWFIGVVNLSGIRSQHKASDYLGTPLTYHVTIRAEELSPYQVLFNTFKCSDVGGIIPAGTDTMRNGMLEFTLESKDLLVLKSFEKTDMPDYLHDIEDPAKWLKIYPNPAYDKVFVELPGYNGKLRAVVYDLTGKMMCSGNMSNGDALDINNLFGGTYILMIRDEDGNIFRQKLIIHRKY